MTKVALLIGISIYQQGLNPLPGAVKDAEAMKRVLQHSEMGCFDEVEQLINPSRQNMEQAIETWFKHRRRDDLLLLFFSGHGIKDESGKLYFATSETRKDERGELVRTTAVAASLVHECMNRSRSKRQVVILDCCFSGAFSDDWQAKGDASVDLKSELGAEGRVVLTSSTSTQYSFEQQGADLSVFTRYIVEGIETGAADQDGDGVIAVDELHDYASSKVQEAAPAMNPKILVLKDEGFRIFISKAPTNDPKLKYRREVENYANRGEISLVGRRILAQLHHDLRLLPEEVAEIESEVLAPFVVRKRKLHEYEQAFAEAIQQEYPLTNSTVNDLKRFQNLLELRDTDVSPIKEHLTAQFLAQREEYQSKLQQYEKKFLIFVQQEYPFSYYTRNELKKLQQSLQLTDEDTAAIERHSLLKATSNTEGHQRKLQQYKQKLLSFAQQKHPLTDYMRDELKKLQKTLQLEDKDVAIVETEVAKHISAQREEYQARLQRYEIIFSQMIKQKYPISSYTRSELNRVSESLNLRRDHIIEIEARLTQGSKAQEKPQVQSTEIAPDEWSKRKRAGLFRFIDSLLDDK